MKRILIVDDDRRMRRTLQIVIESIGFESVAAADATEALEHLSSDAFDLVVTDLKMPGISGLELLERIRAEHSNTPVIVITAYGTIQTAIEAMKKGASDYVLKPFDNDNLHQVIRRALELARFRVENVFLREQIGEAWAPEELFLTLPSMRTIGQLIEDVAASASPVLVRGETGTGKELAARCIHDRSPRRSELFVPLNCAALPAELLEAELFGHARGAFTGADHERQGKFELANGGTLFLDEIGDMPLALQAKLLRVLEDGVIEPLGTNRRVHVDVRIVSATNKDLEEAIRSKSFRDDLLYRLNTFEVALPPLRERQQDIQALASAFLQKFSRELGKNHPLLNEEALELLRNHDWPGNVRELRNVMERSAVLCRTDSVDGDFFRAVLGPSTHGRPIAHDGDQANQEMGVQPLAEAVEEYERRAILRALDHTGDNKAKAARLLEISERNLWYKLRKHGL